VQPFPDGFVGEEAIKALGRSSLFAMDDPMPLGRGVSLPLREVTMRTSRSSGPGGQHANVTASRVEAVLDVAESSLAPELKRRIIARCGPRVTATAQDARSQARNRELALERLQRRLRAALEVRRHRVGTRPTRASVRRRLDSKRRQAERKRHRQRPGSDEG
jgi:ribosome-associated protein